MQYACQTALSAVHACGEGIVGLAARPGEIVHRLAQGHEEALRKAAREHVVIGRHLLEKGAVVLGVSKDSVASHKKFEEKFGLPFTLLSDTEKEVIQAYDVWKEKKNYGKVSMGVVRTTYLIDEDGVIVKAHGNVKAAENPTQMLAEI